MLAKAIATIVVSWTVLAALGYFTRSWISWITIASLAAGLRLVWLSISGPVGMTNADWLKHFLLAFLGASVWLGTGRLARWWWTGRRRPPSPTLPGS